MRSKIITPEIFRDIRKNLRPEGARLVFTNGCFDLLHAGHVRYLEAARAEGDFLMVGINTDRSVKRIKGEKRPIVPEQMRAEVIAGLGCVDWVILFDENTPADLIEAVCPNVLVKGDDWPESEIVGARSVRQRGGRVVRIPFVHEISTTSVIREIIRRFSNGSGMDFDMSDSG
jgi:D-glycero-beta-D-manno-heptose 1-phosphate adenylyltransferase